MSHRPLASARFDPWGDAAERAGLGRRRKRLLGLAAGRVLDLGGGDGYNFALYPEAVEHITVLEGDWLARRRLEDALAAAPAWIHDRVDIRPVGVEDYDPAGERFDAVVSGFALCSVDDLVGALVRVRDWLRPDGVLLYLEHVRAPGRRGRLQTWANPAWQFVVPGCHLDRDINAAIWSAGMIVASCDHFALPMAAPIVGRAVEGVARPRRGPPPHGQHDHLESERTGPERTGGDPS